MSSLSNSKNHYVAIELECLAIVLPVIDRYIYGKRTAVETDHKLLEEVVHFGSATMATANVAVPYRDTIWLCHKSLGKSR